MSYVKLCQICDKSSEQEKIDGFNYVEDVDGNIAVLKTLSFPLTVVAEVINFGTVENYSKRGSAVVFTQEVVIIPDNSTTIRNSVFNQLLEKYPNLVK